MRKVTLIRRLRYSWLSSRLSQTRYALLRVIVRCLGVLALAQALCSCGGRQGVTTPPSDGPTIDSGTDFGAASSCDAGGTIQVVGTRWTCGDEHPAIDWTTGAPCIPGSSLQYQPGADSSACLTKCECDVATHLQCETNCSLPHSISDPACAPGMTCQRGVGCGPGVPPGPDECVTGCDCDPTGHYLCAKVCPNECGLPIQTSCVICSTGLPSCDHYVLLNGVCAHELCPEDGPL